MTDGSAIRTFWYGVLYAIGAFDLAGLTDMEREDIAQRRTWFWLGEVSMAGVLAGVIAVPAGIWFTGHTELPLAFIGAAVLFLPLFVFLPKLIRRGMKMDSDAVIDALGKNEQVKKVFWALFVAMAGLVFAQVLDPATAQQIVGIITSAVP
ncbi:MAG: hypothetical protein WC379_13445 [Methanoregula sp.]|jgi:O-antigen/teichoic acid export membrane protein